MARTKAEVEAYLDKHDLRKKMEEALNKVIEEMPNDPMSALAKVFGGGGGGGGMKYTSMQYPRSNTLLAQPAGAKYTLAVVQFKIEGAKNGG